MPLLLQRVSPSSIILMNILEFNSKSRSCFGLLRPNKSDPILMTRTKRTEILSELTPKIIDLNFTRAENDLCRTELNSNIFLLKSFFFSRKAYWTKNQLTRSQPKLKTTWLETEPESNHVDPKMTQHEANPSRTGTELPFCQV